MGYIQKEWLVYFYEHEHHIEDDWLFFLKKGFKHCGAMGYDPIHEIWTNLEYTHDGIRCSHLTPEEANNLINYFYDYKMLRCPVKNNWQLLRIKDVTCVSWVQRLIGFYQWWIFTPYQLYCALKKAGYKSFYEEIKDPNAKKEQIDTGNH